jgi:hypothetical protein
MSFKRQTLVCVAIGCGLVATGASVQALPVHKVDACQSVPSSGNIGPTVYAQTANQSSSFWQWGGSSLGQAYHWYVFNSAGTLLADGQVNNGSGASTFVSPGIHYWKVQNQGSGNQHWNGVCSTP